MVNLRKQKYRIAPFSDVRFGDVFRMYKRDFAKTGNGEFKEWANNKYSNINLRLKQDILVGIQDD